MKSISYRNRLRFRRGLTSAASAPSVLGNRAPPGWTATGAPGARAELPLPGAGQLRFGCRHLARVRRAHRRRLGSHRVRQVGGRPPDRGLPAGHRHRRSRRPARRSSLAPPPDGRVGSRALRGLPGAAVRQQPAADHRPRGSCGLRHRLLPAGGVRGAAEPRHGPRAAERQRPRPVDRGDDDDHRPLDRRHPRRRLGPRRRVLDQLGHVPLLGRPARANPELTAPGGAHDHCGPLARPS